MTVYIKPLQTKEEIVRGIAFQVFVLAIAGAVFSHPLPVLLLAVDFTIRAFFTPKYSVLALASKNWIAPVFRFRKNMVALRPKKFAAKIGLVLSLTALTLQFFNLPLPAQAVLLILALFSSLEAFARFCAGCKIFALLINAKILKSDFCEDCS
jgi:hypothetical protein